MPLKFLSLESLKSVLSGIGSTVAHPGGNWAKVQATVNAQRQVKLADIARTQAEHQAQQAEKAQRLLDKRKLRSIKAVEQNRQHLALRAEEQAKARQTALEAKAQRKEARFTALRRIARKERLRLREEEKARRLAARTAEPIKLSRPPEIAPLTQAKSAELWRKAIAASQRESGSSAKLVMEQSPSAEMKRKAKELRKEEERREREAQKERDAKKAQLKREETEARRAHMTTLKQRAAERAAERAAKRKAEAAEREQRLADAAKERGRAMKAAAAAIESTSANPTSGSAAGKRKVVDDEDEASNHTQESSISRGLSTVRKVMDDAVAGVKRKRLGGIADIASREGFDGGLQENTSNSQAKSFEAIREGVTLLAAPAADPDVLAAEASKRSYLVQQLRQMMIGELDSSGSKAKIGPVVAMDCEMVGAGSLGRQDLLARVSIVNYYGHVMYDTFVQPTDKVTDWRTRYSGVRPKDVVGAPTFDEVQKHVGEMLEGRTVVGHSISSDFAPLKMTHPYALTRDTQSIKSLTAKMGISSKSKISLKKAMLSELGVGIQERQHSSVVDSRATMALYRLYQTEIEKAIAPVFAKYRRDHSLPHSLSVAADAVDAEANGEPTVLATQRQPRINDGSKWARSNAYSASPPRFVGRKTPISSGLGKIVYRNGKRMEPKRRGPPSSPASTATARAARPSSSGETGSASKWWQYQ